MKIRVLSFVLLLAGCISSHRTEHLRSRVWITPGAPQKLGEEAVSATQEANQERFTTAAIARHEFPESEIESLKGRSDVGLAFSGGGNRAAVCALGQVRALTKLGLMKKVRYVSAVSGGSWFSVPYTYHHGDEQVFLGDHVEPENLDLAYLSSKPARGSFARCASQARTWVVPTVLSRRGDENYAYRLNKIYLDDFGPLGDPRRFFCHDEKTLADILQRNPHLTRNDFNIAAPGRPYVISNAVLDIMGPTREDKFLPIEMTSNYTGGAAARKANYSDFRLGGGYVESFGYDSKLDSVEQLKDGWLAKVRLPRRWGVGYLSSSRFSLSDVMAASGSAPTVPFPFVSYLVGFPQFWHWSPATLPSAQSKEKIHTDGGGIDNAGVIPLLRRRVGTVIAFVNTQMEIDREGRPEFPDYVGALFGEEQFRFASQRCQVFDKNELKSLSDEFSRKWDVDAPLVIQRHYTTQENTGYGIPAGHKVKMIWVFLGGSNNKATLAEKPAAKGSVRCWRENLHDSSRSLLESSDFSRFPYYRTFFENGPYILKLPVAKVNALAHFTSYNVMATQKIFKSAF